MSYQIIPTLGPASREVVIWRAMLSAGASAFRLNTSHLNLTELDQWVTSLLPILDDGNIPLILDLQGSKWRIGEVESMQLQAGQRVTLWLGSQGERTAHSQELRLPVPHADFFCAAADSDGIISLNDAKVILRIAKMEKNEIHALVTQPGLLSRHKGITLPGSSFRAESLSEKDTAIFGQTYSLPRIRYAISYIKDSIEMSNYRSVFEAISGKPAHLIAKLERALALADVGAIAAQSDELWLCRGDLGAEMGLKGMAEAVHELGQRIMDIHKPVLMAGQVLEHMTISATPTRSEICYLYDALAAGYAGVVLSDEAAVGNFGVESVQAAALFL